MQIRDRVKELRRVKAGDLIPNPRNWRTHPKPQQDALRGILAEVGYAGALLAYETEAGVQLIDGHLRAETTPDMEVPVLILDVNEAEADKLLATHDPLGAMAEADATKLDELLRAVDINNDALQAMLAELATDAGLYADSGEIVEDTPPEPPTNPITTRGDVWVLGRHRLVCGDSTNKADVASVLAGAKPFLMVTDPPYGVEYDPTWRVEARDGNFNGVQLKDKSLGLVSNDNRSDWAAAYGLFSGVVAYVWHGGRFTGEVASHIEASGFEVRTQIIWKKPHFAISRGHYHGQHEPCWYAVRKGCTSKWCGDRTQSTIWSIDAGMGWTRSRMGAEDAPTGHGTQKPVECMARPIRNHGGAEDDVYDPFLGSGTTIIAAEQLGRRCYGLEIDPAYCDVIVERWQNLTGEKAQRQASAAA